MTDDIYAQNAVDLILKPSQTVLDALRESGLDFVAPCGGNGRCGKCKVIVSGANLAPLGRDEREFLSSWEIGQGVRLACMLTGEGPCQVRPLEKDPSAAADWCSPRDLGGIASKAESLQSGKQLGVAVDLGTTKVHAQLVEPDGQALASTTSLNAQAIFGSDIMSRMKAATNSRAGELKDRICAQLDNMVLAMCREAGVEPGLVGEMCIVGNTAMIHLLMGWPVQQLAFAPYQPFTTKAQTITAGGMGLTACPGAQVYLPAAIGGFVGSDHLAMLLAAGLDRSGQVALGIDIGTNTEINLNIPAEKRSVSISCPSGPAFEGGEISCGMLAVRGAIVDLAPGPAGFIPVTVEDAPPEGICGSGMIRALDLCSRLGIINSRGRIRDLGPYSETMNGQRRIRLGAGGEQGLFLTQEDVDAILLAKAAISAGIKLIMDRENLELARVDRIVLAGSFGNHLDIQSAVNIGMLPGLPEERFEKAGNAAARGAREMLLSPRARQRAEAAAKKIEHLELQGLKAFRRLFAKAFYLPKTD